MNDHFFGLCGQESQAFKSYVARYGKLNWDPDTLRQDTEQQPSHRNRQSAGGRRSRELWQWQVCTVFIGRIGRIVEEWRDFLGCKLLVRPLASKLCLICLQLVMWQCSLSFFSCIDEIRRIDSNLCDFCVSWWLQLLAVGLWCLHSPAFCWSSAFLLHSQTIQEHNQRQQLWLMVLLLPIP